MSLRYKFFEKICTEEDFLDACKKNGLKKIFLLPILSQVIFGAEGSINYQGHIRMTTQKRKVRLNRFIVSKDGMVPSFRYAAESTAEELLQETEKTKNKLEQYGFQVKLLPPVQFC